MKYSHQMLFDYCYGVYHPPSLFQPLVTHTYTHTCKYIFLMNIIIMVIAISVRVIDTSESRSTVKTDR